MFEFYQSDFDCWNGRRLSFFLRADTVDFDAINSSVFHDEYQLKEFSFVDNDVILDIGAASGGEAVAMATLNPTMRIISVEPIPENIALLKRNLELNKIKNVEVCEQPIAGSVRDYKLQYGDINTENGKKHRFVSNAPITEGGDIITRESITLPLLFEKYNLDRVKLLRIDAEGPELEVFQNTPPKILNKIDYIIGEHHNCKRSEIAESLKIIFRELPCDYQEDGGVGHFRFVNIRRELECPVQI